MFWWTESLMAGNDALEDREKKDRFKQPMYEQSE